MDPKSVIEEDFQVLIMYLEKEDIERSNILCNRMISNAAILEEEQLILLGFSIKVCILYLLRLRDQEKQIEYQKEMLNIIKNTSFPIDINVFIQRLYGLFRKLIVGNLNENEIALYNENSDYVKVASEFYITALINDINSDAIDPRNYIIFDGLLAELDLIFKTHGMNQTQFLLIVFIELTSRIFDYFRRILFYSNYYNEFWSIEIKDFLNRIKSVLEIYINKQDSDDFITKLNEILVYLGKTWRLMYFRMHNAFPSQQIEQKTVEIQKKIKDELASIARKHIKNEVGNIKRK